MQVIEPRTGKEIVLKKGQKLKVIDLKGAGLRLLLCL